MRKIISPFWFCFPRDAFFPAVGLAVVLGVLSILPCRQTAQGDNANEPSAEPVALRRVLLSPERLLAELERVKRGQLTRLPREEFEDRVKQAVLAGEALRHPPRLIESRYRATLVDSALQGTGEWKIVHPGKEAGVLAVEPLGIALRQARWPDNKDAILGDLDGKEPRNLEVLVEQPGERSLFLEWSARSNPVPGGLRFSLDVPACAVATLDLDLPEDHELSGSRDLYLISGPHPAAAPNRRNWRVGFSGRSQVNLVVQSRGAGLPAPLVISRQQTRQEVSPGQLQADYDFDIEVLHGGVKELRCECPATLRPTEINVRNLEGWELRAAGGDNPSTLLIRLREPLRAGKLQVRCLASLPADKNWTSPGLRLLDALSRGENLVLRIHPEVQLEDWKPAGFRLTQSVFSPEGWHELTLRAGLDAGPNPERPSARFQAPRFEYQVRQVGWWQVGPGGMSLTARLTYEVTRGRLFRLPVRLPAGWTVAHVELTPAGLLRHWSIVSEKGQSTLVADLRSSLGPAGPAVLTVQARPTQPLAVPAGELELPFPDLVPLEARLRSGGLGINVGSMYRSNVTASAPAAAPEAGGEAESGESRPRLAGLPRVSPPWGKHPPDYYFPFRGQAVEGTLHLRARATRLQVRCTSDVVLASGHAVNLIRLELHPDIGTPDHVDLLVFGPPPASWEWQTARGNNRVHGLERLSGRESVARLAALASRQPLQAIAWAALPPPRGSWWRLHLASPLTEPLTLETRVELAGVGLFRERASRLLVLGSQQPLGALALLAAGTSAAEAADDECRWDVPLVTVPEAERRDGRITLHLAGTDLIHATARGLEETRVPASSDALSRPLNLSPASSWRTFQYGTLPMSLVLVGRPADRSVEAAIDGARLTTYLEPTGRLLHRYRFRAWNWRQQTVPLVLPTKARLLAARSDGRWLERLLPGQAANGCPCVELPVIADRVPHRFEVVYETDRPDWSLWSRLEAPAPSPPVRDVALERIWCLPRDVVPVGSSAFPDEGMTEPESDIGSLAELSAGMTVWRPIAGETDLDCLTVIRPRWLPLFGLMLALLLGGAAVRFGPRLAARTAARMLLGWLALGGWAFLWLPSPLQPLAWWPELTGACLALAWCVRWARGRRVALPGAALAGAIAFAWLVGLAGRAAAPEPATVYVVPEADGKKQTVLASAELLDRLQTLARRGAAGLRGAILLGAVYEGRVEGDNAHFEARFPVHCFGDGPATLTLPMGGIQLTEAMLDGAPTHPVPLRAPREGYALEIKGGGSHTVLLRFIVPVHRNNDDRDLRFGVPELPRGRLTLEVPGRVGYLHAAEARGSQRVQGTRLEADLGAIGTVRVRWRHGDAQPGPTAVTVREAYYWDLRASSARLLALLHYTVTKGWTSRFALDLPAQIEVVSVEAGPSAPRLKEWRLEKAGAGRRLLLEFQEPVASEVHVSLELVPRQSFGRTAPLVFPTPRDAQPARGFLAYHVEGLDATVDQYHAVTGIDRRQVAETFAESFGKAWRVARQEDLPVPTRAYWRGRDGTLRLNLEPPRTSLRCRQDVTWQVKPRQASLKTIARLAVPDGNLAFVEWSVPGHLVVTEVAGPHVCRWTRSSGRVQVWLQKPVAETTLQMSGWLPRSPHESGHFDVPPLPIGPRPQTTTLHVIAGDGLTLLPQALRNLTAQPEQGVPGREWVYTTESSGYGVRFQTSSAVANTRFRLLTFAEARDGQLAFVTTLQCQVLRGDLRSLTVALRNWEGGEVTLEASHVVRRREQRRGAGGRSWVLDFKPGITGSYSLTLTGSMALGATPEILVPDARVEAPGLGPVVQERWVAVAGPELTGEDASGLTSVTRLNTLKEWQGEMERLRRAGGQAWRVAADDWRLRLRSRVHAPLTVPVQVFLTEHALAVVNARQWTHEVTYRLYHQDGAALGVTLPEGAMTRIVAIDGKMVPLSQPGAERLWLPLPGAAGSRTVRVGWSFAEGRETLGTPSLECPRLDGLAGGPTVWTLYVPPGFELGLAHAGRTVSTGAASLDLWRAAAQLRLRERGVPVDDTFAFWCRQTEQQLGQPGVAVAPGPNGQPAATWLQELRDEYRRLAPPEPPTAKERPLATPTESSFALATSSLGHPLYWQTAGEAAPPRITLRSLAAEKNSHRLTLSALVLAVWLALTLLARFFQAGSGRDR